MSHFAPYVVAGGLCAIFLPLCAAETVPLRVSVVSSAAKSCPGADVHQDIEGRLRAAGFTLSSVHNAEVGVELDCVSVSPGARVSPVAVHECLNFSELVPSPEKPGRSILASTWRQCQSYTSGKPQYQASVRMRTASLFKLFLADYQDRAASPPPAAPAPPPAAVAIVALPRPSAPALPKRPALFCLSLVLWAFTIYLYWHFRKRRFVLSAEQDHAA